MKLGNKKGHGRETEINRQTDALVDGWTEMLLKMLKIKITLICVSLALPVKSHLLPFT